MVKKGLLIIRVIFPLGVHYQTSHHQSSQDLRRNEMSIKDLERAILSELRVVAKNNKLRLKDLMEWSTSDIKAQEGETLYYLPDLHINCAVKVIEK
jgi:hypothetical protein